MPAAESTNDPAVALSSLLLTCHALGTQHAGQHAQRAHITRGAFDCGLHLQPNFQKVYRHHHSLHAWQESPW